MEKICQWSDAQAGLFENASMQQDLWRMGVFFEHGDNNDQCCRSHQRSSLSGIRGHFQLPFSGLFALGFGQGISNGSRFGSIRGLLPNDLRRKQIGEDKAAEEKEGRSL